MRILLPRYLLGGVLLVKQTRHCCLRSCILPSGMHHHLQLQTRGLFRNSAPDAAAKLAQLRHEMKLRGLDVYVIPSEDPHMSEYPPQHYCRREYISGFTGSAGTALVSHSDAFLFTDGRYFEQAERELDSSLWTLMKSGMPTVPTLQEFLCKRFPKASKIGIDGNLHTIREVKKWNACLNKSHCELVVASKENLIDIVWSDRPKQQNRLIRCHPLQYSGESTMQKLTRIREEMNRENCNAYLVSALDEVCWALNIRGNDSEFNQLAECYALITSDKAYLFINPAKLNSQIISELSDNGVMVRSYELLIPTMQETVEMGCGATVWMDDSKTSYTIYKQVSKALLKTSCIASFKAKKNDAELQGMRNAHIRDGVAMVNALSYLEDEVRNKGNQELTEVDVDKVLKSCRKQVGHFIEPSFATIAGYGKNGAVVHYRANSENCATIGTSKLLLIDSGGHYDDGTTDITRTVHFGKPTLYEIEMNTRVLKGHIALATAVFPKGTTGTQLDVLARQYLWSIGRDYAHGTGHGVGAALCVHEGPQRISKAISKIEFVEGMIVSNEPGYYEVNEFGIRIENLLEVVYWPTEASSVETGFLTFKPLTLVPFQLSLIDVRLLSTKEIEYINSYHQQVRGTLSPLISNSHALNWLLNNTKPIQQAKIFPV